MLCSTVHSHVCVQHIMFIHVMYCKIDTFPAEYVRK